MDEYMEGEDDDEDEDLDEDGEVSDILQEQQYAWLIIWHIALRRRRRHGKPVQWISKRHSC
jgi:hypothetical protein